jgi:pyrroloquinoline-quinone synthase
MTGVERMSPELFVERLRQEGRRRYHDSHPFNKRMHAGDLTREEFQTWVANRYYYQTRIPIKDAIILSKSEDPAFRRMWIRRLTDHDGQREGEGGIYQWLRLAAGVGLDAEHVKEFVYLLPGVRFACDAYVQLVRERSLVEAVASSLTELFSPDLMAKRITAVETHYPWVDREVLTYFRERVLRARWDSEEAIGFVLRAADTRELQEKCISAFITKCEILWSMLDAVQVAHRSGAGVGGLSR